MSKSIKNAIVSSAAASIAAVPATGGAEVISTVAVATKADKARAIFTECMAQSPVPARKDIINRFQTEAGLTKAGAGTYLQKCKDKAGLTVHKAKAVEATA